MDILDVYMSRHYPKVFRKSGIKMCKCGKPILARNLCRNHYDKDRMARKRSGKFRAVAEMQSWTTKCNACGVVLDGEETHVWNEEVNLTDIGVVFVKQMCGDCNTKYSKLNKKPFKAVIESQL